MKKLLLILFLSIAYLCTTHAQSFTKLEVKQSMRRVADWQIGHYNRAVYGDLNWVNATFFLGLAYWAEIAEKDDQDDFYYKWLTRLGSRNYWQVDKRMYHADDICIAQTYLYLYEKVQAKGHDCSYSGAYGVGGRQSSFGFVSVDLRRCHDIRTLDLV